MSCLSGFGGLTCAAFLAGAVATPAQQTLVSGRVVDGDGKAVPGVLAVLLVKGFSDSTDSDGYFTVFEGQATVGASHGPVRASRASVRKGIVRLRGGSAPAAVRVRVLNLQGRLVAEPFNGWLAPNHPLHVSAFATNGGEVLARGMYLLEISIDGIVSRQKVAHMEGDARPPATRSGPTAAAMMGKTQAVVDTLRLTKNGCPSKDVPVAGYGSDIGEIELLCQSDALKELDTWPLDETSGTTFADAVGSNDAVLNVPDWTVATHECNRPGIVEGSDHALEVGNGGPAIPMIAAYRQAAMSLVIYIEPRGELRGVQYWDEADERFGRELIAYCDDGSAPGSFAIYRRREGYNTAAWRLGGYVRDGVGAKKYFGGDLGGISSTSLPADAAKRIVLAQGPGGATLYLDGSQVANLPSVTQGWSSLTTAITLGSSSNTGHANDRSPLWGRLDQIEVWQGQMALADVQNLAAAAQSTLWRYPSDFVGGSTDINIANYANNGSAPQAAMNAAAGRYVYQAKDDATWYTASDQGADNAVAFKPGCKGFINVRLKRPSGQNSKWDRIFNISNQSGGQMGASHGNPYAASGGWKFIGCKFDANARGQDWHPKSGQPGYGNTGFAFEQAHIFFVGNDVEQTFTWDACDFMDGTGDALGLDKNTVATIKSCRFWGVFRGSLVVNALPVSVQQQRVEVFSGSRPGFGSLNQGCGLDDIEAFGGTRLTLALRDTWAESDFDDESGTPGSTLQYVNCHMLAGAHRLRPGETSGSDPVDRWEARYCTFSYHSNGGNGTGSYPPSAWSAFHSMGGTGCLFDHCVFIANGRPYNYHESWIVTPVSSKRFYIIYERSGTQSRLWTMRNCQWRVTRLPGGIARTNVQAVEHGGLGTGQSVELDGVTIDAAFADLPFAMGGVTVRYRNVVHEGTGGTKPWSGAGAEVAF